MIYALEHWLEPVSSFYISFAFLRIYILEVFWTLQLKDKNEKKKIFKVLTESMIWRDDTRLFVLPSVFF